MPNFASILLISLLLTTALPVYAIALPQAQMLALQFAPSIIMAKKQIAIRQQQVQIAQRSFAQNPNVGIDVTHNEQTSPTYNLSLDQHIDFSHKLKMLRLQASLNQQIAEYKWHQENRIIASKVRKIFNQAWIISQQKQFTLRLLNNEKILETFLHKRQQAGLISLEDLTPVEIDIARDSAQQVSLQSQLSDLQFQLSQLIGQSVETIELSPPVLSLSSKAILTTKLASNPRLKIAELNTKVAQSQQKEQQQNRYFDSMTVKLHAENDAGQAKVGAGIKLPFPVWNQKQDEIKIQALSVLKAKAAQRQTHQDLQQRLNHAFAQASASLQALQLLNKTVLVNVTELLSYTQKRYQQGLVGLSDLEIGYERYRTVMNQRMQYLQKWHDNLAEIQLLTQQEKQ